MSQALNTSLTVALTCLILALSILTWVANVGLMILSIRYHLPEWLFVCGFFILLFSGLILSGLTWKPVWWASGNLRGAIFAASFFLWGLTGVILPHIPFVARAIHDISRMYK